MPKLRMVLIIIMTLAAGAARQAQAQTQAQTQAATDTGTGPAIDLPREMPATGLPRETPVENPLGREAAVTGTAIGGYGELTLNAPSVGPAVVDLRRFVLFIGHNFSERLRFYSEVEVEH